VRRVRAAAAEAEKDGVKKRVKGETMFRLERENESVLKSE
jgi:hypothetical protein